MRSAAKIKARIQITSFDWTRSQIQAPSSRREDSNNAREQTGSLWRRIQQAVKPSPWGPRLRHSRVKRIRITTLGKLCKDSGHCKEAPFAFQVLQPRAASVHVRSAGPAHTRRVFGLREQCSSHVLPLTCNHCWNTSPCIQKTPPRPCRRCGIKSWTRGIICA